MGFFSKIKNFTFRNFFSKSFLIFLIIGFVNTFNGTIFSSLFALKLNPNISFYIGYFIALAIAYVLNSFFAFKEKLSIDKMLKFFISYIPNFLIQSIVVFILNNKLHVHHIVAYLVAAIIGIPITFLLIKLFAFKKVSFRMVSGREITGFGKSYSFLRHNKWVLFIVVFLIYILLASLSNWSLLTGDNLMKFDIFDAHLPNSVFLSDSLKSGILPLWNPSMQFGSPHYSIVGTPVFYPTTLICALIGYRPSFLGVEYVFHIALGCFGMFLLSKEYLSRNNKTSFTELILSFIAGLLYGFSTVFISNAQHIMIFISAAWIPLVFYFIIKFLKSNKLVYLFTASICAALMFMGGYPELFAALFICLIPIFVYYNYNKQKSFFVNIIQSGLKYILFIILTVLAGAISILPFLNSASLLNKTMGAMSLPPVSAPIYVLFSSLIPKLTSFINFETSMASCYIGILTIATIPLVLIYKNKHKMFYLAMIVFSFLMYLGSHSFLHSIFYRFFPAFNNFRFPTLWRCMIAIFLITLCVSVWRDMLLKNKTKMRNKIILNFKVLIFIFIGISLILWIVSYISQGINVANAQELSSLILISVFIFAIYLGVFYSFNNKQFKPKTAALLLCVCVIIEVFTFQYMDTPGPIAMYKPTESLYNQDAYNSIKKHKDDCELRNRSVDYSDAKRSDSFLDSSKLVYNKTLDESGYVSFLLYSSEKYKKSYNRNINAPTPEAFFTNDVTTNKDIDFESWLNKAGTRPAQIYVDNQPKKLDNELLKPLGDISIVDKQNILVTENGVLKLENNKLMSPHSDTSLFRKLSIYTENNSQNSIEATISFYDSSGKVTSFKDVFEINQDGDGKYFDVYFPENRIDYERVEVKTEGQSKLKNSFYIHADRMMKDKSVVTNKLIPNYMSFTVNAEKDGYLTVLQNNHSGWNVYVDGVKTDINEINKTFLGVFLEKGTHTVEFKFVPLDFYVGLSISALFVCGWVSFLIFEGVRLKRKNKKD